MGLQKQLGIAYVFGRYALLLGSLLLLQKSGWLDHFLAQHPSLRVETLKDFCAAIFLIGAGRLAVLQGLSNLCNHLTPIQYEATFIETEIVDALAFCFGSMVFVLIFTSIGFVGSLQAGCVVALASLPSLLFGWGIRKLTHHLYPATSSSDVQSSLGDAPENEPDLVQASDQELEQSHQRKSKTFWRPYLAYVFAAAVFNLTFTAILASIVYLKTGGFAGVKEITISCTIMTFVILVVFGNLIVGLGHKALNLLRLKTMSERLRHSLAYLTGYMIFLTFFAGLCILGTYATDPSRLLSVWAYGMAYVTIAVCAILAGLTFARFYTPKNLPY